MSNTSWTHTIRVCPQCWACKGGNWCCLGCCDFISLTIFTFWKMRTLAWESQTEQSIPHLKQVWPWQTKLLIWSSLWRKHHWPWWKWLQCWNQSRFWPLSSALDDSWCCCTPGEPFQKISWMEVAIVLCQQKWMENAFTAVTAENLWWSTKPLAKCVAVIAWAMHNKN